MQLRFALLAAALGGLLSVVTPASAETVTYTTSFQFTSGPGSGTDTTTIGAATFQLLGTTNTLTTPSFSAPFGTIVYNSNNNQSNASGLFDFTFSITQISPAGVASSFANQFFGAVVLNAGIASIDFVAGPPLQIGNIRYTPQDASAGFIGGSGTAPILGSVVAVPLPAAAWGGMALCAMVGVWKFRRNSEAEV